MAGVEKLVITLPTLSLSTDNKLESPDTPLSPNVLKKSQSKEAESPVSPVSPGDLEKCLDEEIKPHNYPEGGLKAYMTIVAAFMVFACTFGRMSAFGTFQAWYASHQLQHLSESTISWIGSIQYCIFFFSVRLYLFFLISLPNSFYNQLTIRVLPLDACSMHMDQLG